MSDVFISYSRKDSAFVRQLHDALTAHQRESWVDWRDIPLTAQWWTEIQRGIEAADSFLFVISPDSLASQVCQQEIEHANRLKKRMIPIVRREVANQSVHEALASHQWLFMREDDDFEQAFGRLLRALDTDLSHVRAHTRLLTRAREWEDREHNNSLLLRGTDLNEAEAWLQSSAGKEPPVNALQQAYIFTSRRAATARSRVLLAGVALAAVVALVLAAVALLQRNEAERQRELAVAAEALAVRRADEAQSLALTFGARQSLGAGDGDLALALALVANDLDDPPFAAEAMLAQVAYAPGTRRVFSGVHNGWVGGLGLTPDGSRLLTGSYDGTLALWDVETGEVLQQVQFGQMIVEQGVALNLSGVNDLAMHPRDGSRAVLAQNAIVLWDVERWSEVSRFELPSYIAQAVAYSADGRLIAAAISSGELLVLDGESLRVLLTVNAHADSANAVAISPDGAWIATGGPDGTARLWDAETGRMEQEWTLEGATAINSLTFTLESDVLIVGPNSGQVTLYNVETGREVRRLAGRSGADALAVSPDGRLLALPTGEGPILLVDPATGAERARLVGHTTRAVTLAFSPDGRLLYSGGLDNTVRSWHVFGGALETFLRGGYAEGASIGSLVPLSGGRLLTGGGQIDPRVLLWQDGVPVLEMNGHTDSVIALAVSPDETVALSSGFDGTVRRWDLASGALLSERKIEESQLVGSIQFSADGQRALVMSMNQNNFDSQLIILDAASLEPLASFTLEWTVMLTAVWNADETTALVAGSAIQQDGAGVLLEVDVATGDIRRRFPQAHDGPIYSVTLSPDGQRLASSSEEGLIVIWNAETAQEQRRLVGHSDIVRSVRFSPDGELVLSISYDLTARVWATGSWEELARLEGHTDQLTTGAFSADGLTAYTGSRDGTVGVWEVALSSEAIRQWLPEERFVRELSCPERLQYNVPPLCS